MAQDLINDDSSVDETPPLRPTKIFFLNSSSGDFSDELHVLDLTPLITMADYTGTMTDAFRKQVERAAKANCNARSAWAFELTRGTFSSRMQMHDASAGGALVAELDMPVLKRYSAWKMCFPSRGREVEVRPVSVWKKQEAFVVDGESFLWDMSGGGKRGVLGKKVDGRSGPVAEFVAKSWFENSCVLMLDAEQVDEVVALASCVAVLNRNV